MDIDDIDLLARVRRRMTLNGTRTPASNRIVIIRDRTQNQTRRRTSSSSQEASTVDADTATSLNQIDESMFRPPLSRKFEQEQQPQDDKLAQIHSKSLPSTTWKLPCQTRTGLSTKI
jgi:hypothetical protein